MKPARFPCCTVLLLAGLTSGLSGQTPGASSPRDHLVLSASSPDGLAWSRDDGVRLTSASVPCALNDGDRRVLLYVVRPPDDANGVGGVSCAVSDNGTDFRLDPAFRIEGLSTLTAVDPSIVRDAAGTYRLYYLASNARGDPAAEANPHRINLAVSDDGLRFRETGTVFTYDNLVDPDVFEYQGRWFMYVFGRGGTVVATSPDGRSFAFQQIMAPPDWGTTAPVLLADGRLRLYAFQQRVPIGNAVASFVSSDGLTWSEEPGVRLQASPNEQITDPFVIRWRGGWKMYFKIAPAPGTGSTTPATTTRLTNLSVRARAGTGSATLIAGFAVTGAGAKPLLLRGVGPALALPPFNLASAVADPRLELFAGASRMAGNDDWSAVATEAAAQAAAQARTGAFPLAAGSRDAALTFNFPAGVYTMQVSPASGATGTALAEIYDADPGGAGATSALTNVSARTQVGVEADILIAGFFVAGAGSQRILIRAVGPSLARFGVTGILPDPRLSVYNGSTLVATNDNWADQTAGAAAVIEAANAAGAFPLDASSADAALALTLPVGAYTAQVSGGGGATGIALLEVYAVPSGSKAAAGSSAAAARR